MKLTKCSFYYRLILLLLLSGTSFSNVYSQDDEEEKEKAELPVKQRKLPFILKIDGGIARLAGPVAMKTNFYSLGDANLTLNFGLSTSISIGASMRYAGFQVREGAANIQIINPGGTVNPLVTVQNIFTPAISLSYNKWVGNSSLFNFGFSTGYSLVRHSKVRPGLIVPSTVYNYNALLFEPKISFASFFEDHVAWSLWVSYSALSSTFKPETLGLDKGVLTYTSEELKGNIKFISFGIGFIYSIKRVK